MKVKEMRHWLNDIGEKQKHQRGRGDTRRRSLASTDNLGVHSEIKRSQSEPEANPTSSRGDMLPGTQKVELQAVFPSDCWKTKLMNEYYAKSDAKMNFSINQSKRVPDPVIDHVHVLDEKSLCLKTNPSADPTVSTRDDSTSTMSDIPQQTASWDTPLVNGGSWDNMDFPDPETNFEFSPSSSFDASTDSMSEGMAYCKHLACRDDYYTREKGADGSEGFEDMGLVHFSLIRKHSSILSCVDDTEELEDSMQEDKLARMHAANIFGHKTLTAGTLDLICNDVTIKQNAFMAGRSADLFADDETSSSLSRDSGSKPSIAPDALDSKMAQLLLDPHPLNTGIKNEAGYKLAHRSIPRCKKIDPKDLHFLQRKEYSHSAAGKPEQPIPSSVAKGIQKFGGIKKTIIQERKEELERLWAENKQKVHVKKIKWGVCQRTGTYKKRVVIDVQK